MQSHKKVQTNSYTSGLLIEPDQERRFRDLFCAVGVPCDRQPDVFYQVRCTTRAPYGAMIRNFRAAIHAAETPAAKAKVVEAIGLFAAELLADARRQLGPVDESLREVFISAQQADTNEDCAETEFLTEQSSAAALRLIGSSRIERQRSELRELALLPIASGQRQMRVLR